MLESFAPKELYESIRDEPFKIPEDDGSDLTKTFFNAEREGMLTKEGELASIGIEIDQQDS